MDTAGPSNPSIAAVYDSIMITHGNCSDGTACAAIFAKLSPQIPWIGKVYYHYAFERDFAKDSIPNLTGKHVFITDYSYPRDVIKHIASIAKSLHLWDHHESAMNDLSNDVGMNVCTDLSKDVSNDTGRRSRVSIVFDMTKCGAEITFQELCNYIKNADKTIIYQQPWWLNHIRDRDLWLWDKPGAVPGVTFHKSSKAFHAAFQEMTPSVKNLLLIWDYTDLYIDVLYSRGEAILKFEARLIRNIGSKAERVLFEGYDAYFVDSPVFQSDVGNYLIKDLNETTFDKWKIKCLVTPQPHPFKAMIGIIGRYSVREKCWYISLRGRVFEDNTSSPNLANIAKKYGGGGHPMASGFNYTGDIADLLTYCS